MSDSKSAVLLMCSPRGKKSSSYSLGSYFISLLEEKGYSVKIFQVYQTLKDNNQVSEMITAVSSCKIIILSTPLYIDSAPYMTTKLMELITEKVQTGEIKVNDQLLFAISSAGFLEYYHNKVALQIYEQFAKANNIRWAGGLPIGGAGIFATNYLPDFHAKLSSAPELDYINKKIYEIVNTLNKLILASVDYLSNEKAVPREELKKIEFVPFDLHEYVPFANNSWIQWAEQINTKDKLRDKPYQKE